MTKVREFRRARAGVLALSLATVLAAGSASAHGGHHHGGHHHGGHHHGGHHHGGYHHHGHHHHDHHHHHHHYGYYDDGFGTGLAIGGLMGIGVAGSIANSGNETYNACPEQTPNVADRFPGQCY